MPLQYSDQVNLLKDILLNHQTDCYGSVSECEQVERLIKSLLIHGNMDHSDRETLEQIYSYCQQGKNAANLEQHIESHQQQLSQWVNQIDQLS